MSQPENYFIKEGYKPNLVNRTIENGDLIYWNKTRFRDAGYYQYHVYLVAKKLAHQYSKRTMLDIGCGSAIKAVKLLKPVANRLVGIDQKNIIAFCRQQYPDGEFYADDFEHPELDLSIHKLKNTFSLVICADVIEHLIDPDLLINYIRSVSQDNALLVISTPERDVIYGQGNTSPPNPAHIREWNSSEFADYLSSRGLEILQQLNVRDQRFHFEKRYLTNLLGAVLNLQTTKSCQVAVCRIRLDN